ncbi:MAG: hypothetical protein KDA79_12085 [Planctomycetaceae bacterium]|nr:hypothetical protein [Planctomycetaceae bacterium]
MGRLSVFRCDAVPAASAARLPLSCLAGAGILVAVSCLCSSRLTADDAGSPAAGKQPAASSAPSPADGTPADAPAADGAPGDETTAKNPEASRTTVSRLIPLNRQKTVLLDQTGKRLLLRAEVVLDQGLLEMLLCLKQTKEHESILSVDAKAHEIHSGLLVLGARPGHPVQFSPKFQPPAGQPIDIFLQWTDEKGKPHRVDARQWIRHAINGFEEPLAAMPAGLTIPQEINLRYDAKNKVLVWYGQMQPAQRDQLLALSDTPAWQQAIRAFYSRSQPRPMKSGWVFAGSSFYVDEKTGQRFYQAEGGDVVCVANFPTAMIDVDTESSATGESSLLFEAATPHIPPVGTRVTIELIPGKRKPAEKPATDKPAEDKPAESKPSE